MNRTLSKTVLQKWYDHCRPYLQCHTAARLALERQIKEPLRSKEVAQTVKKASDKGLNPQQGRSELTQWSLEPYLLPHEFLYLLCNAEDRLSTIRRVHRVELVSAKGDINHWELLNNAGKQRVIRVLNVDRCPISTCWASWLSRTRRRMW